MRQALERFKVAVLKLKPSKCHFISQPAKYLGHLVTPQGILPNPNRVSAIKEFPVPKSVKEVRKFLGLGSYYRRFIRSPECQQAFQQLKDALVSPPVLAYPNFSKSFTLETDVSVKGWDPYYPSFKMIIPYTQWLMPVDPYQELRNGMPLLN